MHTTHLVEIFIVLSFGLSEELEEDKSGKRTGMK
jgi:hypothetical protein